MGFCTKCGAQLGPNHVFCGECGAPVTASKGSPAITNDTFLKKTKSSGPISAPRPPSKQNSWPANNNNGWATPTPPRSPPPASKPSASKPPTTHNPTPPRSAPPASSAPRGPVNWGTPTQSTNSNNGTNNSADEEQKKKEEERKAKEKEEAKRLKQEEQEYMNGRKQQIMESYINRKEQSEKMAQILDPATCHCVLTIINYEIRNKNNKPDYVVYKLEVEYDNTHWTIFRRFKQFKQVDDVFKREIKGYTPCLPQLESKNKFDPNLLETRKVGLVNYVKILQNNRPAIFSSENSGLAFLRFIAPSQVGDIKPPHFVLPFKII